MLNEAPYSAVLIKEKIEEHFKVKIGYTTVQEYLKKLNDERIKTATVRFETIPGLQAQGDWGFFENDFVVDEFGEKRNYIAF